MISSEAQLEEYPSPFLVKIQECLRIVDDIEAEKKGTLDEKNLSTFDKYKLAVKFMQMTQNPKKFKYLERFTAGESNQVRMNLAPIDLDKRMILEKKI
jgi:predicted RNase H-like nuclease